MCHPVSKTSYFKSISHLLYSHVTLSYSGIAVKIAVKFSLPNFVPLLCFLVRSIQIVSPAIAERNQQQSIRAAYKPLGYHLTFSSYSLLVFLSVSFRFFVCCRLFFSVLSAALAPGSLPAGLLSFPYTLAVFLFSLRRWVVYTIACR